MAKKYIEKRKKCVFSLSYRSHCVLLGLVMEGLVDPGAHPSDWQMKKQELTEMKSPLKCCSGGDWRRWN